MNLFSILFLLAVCLKFSDSCLVIRYSEPPACACKTLKLNSSNIIENRVKNNVLYDTVLSREIKSPEILVEDCFVQVYCEDGAELYIFDMDKGAKMGEYSLDGFCDPYQQKWQVDTGNGIEQYKELKGVCVLKDTSRCSPTVPTTVLFAYSNDLSYIDEVYLVMQHVLRPIQDDRNGIAATVRFDTKTKEDIVFHEAGTQRENFYKAQGHIIRYRVDPSKSFDSSETGSDVLDMLERFIDTNHPSVCGSYVFILMGRNPNEVEISKIVEKIREYRIRLVIVAKDPSVGGLHPETMYELAAKTNGQCSFGRFLDGAGFTVPRIYESNAYYSINVKVSGTGTMVLPPVTFIRDLENMYLGICVQSTGTAQSFQSLTISWENTELGTSGSVTRTREELDQDYVSSLNTFQISKFIENVQPSTYQLKLDYSYSTEDTILIRINSKTASDHWLPYQD